MSRTTVTNPPPKIEILAGDPSVHWVNLSASVSMPVGTQFPGEMREPPAIVVPPAMPAEIQFSPVAPNEN